MEDNLIVFFRCLSEQCGLLCHQLDSRCIVIGSGILPVCARCTGIYLGAWVAFILRFAGKEWRQILIVNRSFWVIALITVFLLTADALAGPHLYGYPHEIRLTTGFLFGFLTMTLFSEWIKMFVLKKNVSNESRISVRFITIHMFIALLIFFIMLLLFSSEEWFFVAMVFMIVSGIMFLYSTANAVLFFWIMKHLRHRCEKRICLTIVLMLGFLLFSVQFFFIQLSGLSL